MSGKAPVAVGDTFGRLTVLALVKGDRTGGNALVRCSCGVEKVVRRWSLKVGTTRSCGCLQRDHWRANPGRRNHASHDCWEVHGRATAEARRSRTPTQKQRDTAAGLAKAIHETHDCSKVHGSRENGLNWRGDDICYISAHARVRVLRGKASLYRCVDCSARAEHWTYNHLDPDEKIGPHSVANPVMMAYSTNEDFYEPRCRRCHERFDRAHHQAEVTYAYA